MNRLQVGKTIQSGTDYFLPEGKSVFFASDFHLGVPTYEQSRKREDKIVRWLQEIHPQAEALFLVGDVFDFWFEYQTVIPKGFIRLQGQLARMTDSGLPIFWFTGNHDMWVFKYFQQELNIPMIYDPISFQINGKKMYVGHGDGLGPGDYQYKITKKILFRNWWVQSFFAFLHPNVGIGIAQFFSTRSQKQKADLPEEKEFLGDKEWLWAYSKELHQKKPHDFYLFGHRHLPLDLPVGDHSRYINIGEWLSHCSYGQFENQNLSLKYYR
jgi:UDP-2,3-diacylglucosamine hydrolase